MYHLVEKLITNLIYYLYCYIIMEVLVNYSTKYIKKLINVSAVPNQCVDDMEKYNNVIMGTRNEILEIFMKEHGYACEYVCCGYARDLMMYSDKSSDMIIRLFYKFINTKVNDINVMVVLSELKIREHVNSLVLTLKQNREDVVVDNSNINDKYFDAYGLNNASRKEFCHFLRNNKIKTYRGEFTLKFKINNICYGITLMNYTLYHPYDFVSNKIMKNKMYGHIAPHHKIFFNEERNFRDNVLKQLKTNSLTLVDDIVNTELPNFYKEINSKIEKPFGRIFFELVDVLYLYKKIIKMQKYGFNVVGIKLPHKKCIPSKQCTEIFKYTSYVDEMHKKIKSCDIHNCYSLPEVTRVDYCYYFCKNCYCIVACCNSLFKTYSYTHGDVLFVLNKNGKTNNCVRVNK